MVGSENGPFAAYVCLQCFVYIYMCVQYIHIYIYINTTGRVIFRTVLMIAPVLEASRAVLSNACEYVGPRLAELQVFAHLLFCVPTTLDDDSVFPHNPSQMLHALVEAFLAGLDSLPRM